MLQYETPKYFKLFYLLVLSLCAKSCVKPYHPHDFFIISFSVYNSHQNDVENLTLLNK